MEKHSIWYERGGVMTLVKEYTPKDRIRIRKKYVTFFPSNKYLKDLDCKTYQRVIMLLDCIQKKEKYIS